MEENQTPTAGTSSLPHTHPTTTSKTQNIDLLRLTQTKTLNHHPHSCLSISPYLTSQSLSFHSHTLFLQPSAVVYQPVQEITSDDRFLGSFHLLRSRNALVRYLVWPTVTSTNASRSVFMCRAFLLVFSFFRFCGYPRVCEPPRWTQRNAP